MADKNLRVSIVLQMAEKVLGPLKKISQGSSETAQTLKAARDQLKQLDATQKAVGQFRETRKGLDETEAKLQAARERVKQLALQFNQAGVPTKAMTTAMAAARTEANKLGAQFNTQQQKVQQLRDKLGAAGISTKNLADHDKRLRASIAATRDDIERQTAALKKQAEQQRKLEEIKKQAQKGAAIGAGMSAAGVASIYAGRQALRPVQAAMGAFSEQENASTQLSASMMVADGSVSKEFAQIDALAKRLGDRLPGTTADFLELMAVLKQQGLVDKTILGGTGEAAALLGVQLHMTAPAAGEFAAKMQDATRTAEKDMLSLMDTIQRGYYMGMDSGNMLQGFSKMSPIMGIIRKEGLEFSKTMAPLLVMMDQTGMEGGSAGNAFRKVFQSAMNKDKIDKVLKDLRKEKGIKLNFDFTNGKGEFGGLDKMYAQLEKLKSMNTQTRLSFMKDIWGDDAETLQVLNAMIDKGKAGYEEIAAKMGAQASLQQRVDQQLGTFTNVVEAAQGSATNALASIGEVMAPQLKELVSWLSDAGSAANDWIKENQALVRWLGMASLGFAGLMVSAGLLLIPLGLLVAKAFAVRWMFAKLGLGLPTLLGGFKALGGSAVVAGGALKGLLLPIKLIGRALLLNPIGLAITAIAGAALLVVKFWQPIKAFFTGFWQGFVQGLAPLGPMFSGTFGVLAGVLSALAPLWDALVSALSAVWGWVSQLFTPFEATKQSIDGATQAGQGFGAWLAGLVVSLASIIPRFVQFGADLVSGVINGITGKLTSLKDTVVGAAESIAKWFSFELKIKSPSRVFTQFGGWISEGAANGIEAGQAGVRAAALALAGTAMLPVAQAESTGAAAATPAPIASIKPAAPRAATAAPVAASPSTYNITINAAPGADAQAIARAVAAELDRRERQASARRKSSLHDLS